MALLFFVLVFYLFCGGFFVSLPSGGIGFIITTLIILFWGGIFFRRIRVLEDKNIEYLIIAGCIIVMIVLFLTGRFYETAFIYLCLMCPAIISLITKSVSDNYVLSRLLFFFVALYIVNAIVAYYERITGEFLFYNGDILWETTEDNELSALIFRSPALFGHPLQNGMIMGYMMVMILLSHIKSSYKLILWLIGFFSLFCFNARGSIILSILLFAWYSFFIAKYKNRLLKYAGLSLIIIAFVSLLIFIFSTPLAGRLLTGDVMEGNGEERIRIWYVLGGMDFVDFMIGLTSAKYTAITKALQLYTCESWLAYFIIRMGAIFTLYFFLLYSKLLWRLLSNVEKARRFFLLSSFFLLASMNNSLSVALTPWLILVLSAPAYNEFYRAN